MNVDESVLLLGCFHRLDLCDIEVDVVEKITRVKMISNERRRFSFDQERGDEIVSSAEHR